MSAPRTASVAPVGHCRNCRTPSSNIHARYVRRPVDLLWCGHLVRPVRPQNTSSGLISVSSCAIRSPHEQLPAFLGPMVPEEVFCTRIPLLLAAVQILATSCLVVRGVAPAMIISAGNRAVAGSTTRLKPEPGMASARQSLALTSHLAGKGGSCSPTTALPIRPRARGLSPPSSARRWSRSAPVSCCPSPKAGWRQCGR